VTDEHVAAIDAALKAKRPRSWRSEAAEAAGAAPPVGILPCAGPDNTLLVIAVVIVVWRAILAPFSPGTGAAHERQLW
jgi:hypothetical protein